MSDEKEAPAKRPGRWLPSTVALAAALAAACSIRQGPRYTPAVALEPRPGHQLKFSKSSETEGRLPEVTLGYELKDAVWLDAQRTLVSREYDFAFAAGMPDLGPALAAARRANENRRVAGLFASEPTPSFEGAFESGLSNGTRQRLGIAEVSVHWMLYGARSARLRTIVEWRVPAEPGRFRWVHISGARPSVGSGSWTEKRGTLAAAHELGALTAARLIDAYWSKADIRPGNVGRCPAGGDASRSGEVLLDGKLRVLRQESGRSFVSCVVDPRDGEPPASPGAP